MATRKIIVIGTCALLIANVLYGSNDVGTCVVEVATSQIGVKEKTGRNDGKEVAMYLKTYGLPEGYAWCAAFVNWVYMHCGIKTKTNAMAASWFPSAKTIYKRNDKKRDYG